MRALLESRYQRPVIVVSALQGDNIDVWLNAILAYSLAPSAGEHWLRELDYDLYTQGEAGLGWLNAVGHLNSAQQVDLDTVIH